MAKILIVRAIKVARTNQVYINRYAKSWRECRLVGERKKDVNEMKEKQKQWLKVDVLENDISAGA